MNTKRSGLNRRKVGRSPGRQHLMELNVRTASLKRQRRQKAGNLLWKVFSTVIILCLLAGAGRLAAQKFFFKNSEYSLKHIEAHFDGIMNMEEFVQATGFTNGQNLFLLDLDQANKKLTAHPEVLSVNLERILPDTIKVDLERRHPVFLILANNEDAEGDTYIPGKSFLCDENGYLFVPTRLNPEFLNLPTLQGIDMSDMVSGKRMENERIHFALHLQKALSEIPEDTFKIRTIDASKPYSVVVTDASNARFTFGSKDIPSQIERLRKLLEHCQETGRHLETANLMIARNTPVTFVLTPEKTSAKIMPLNSGKKGTQK